MRMKQTSMPGSKRPRPNPSKRRRPRDAQTDWARWAHRKFDEQFAERVSRPKA